MFGLSRDFFFVDFCKEGRVSQRLRNPLGVLASHAALKTPTFACIRFFAPRTPSRVYVWLGVLQLASKCSNKKLCTPTIFPYKFLDDAQPNGLAKNLYHLSRLYI